MTARLAAIAALAAGQLAAAPIVSDDATMFVMDGGWMPQKVPNEAVYDTEKEVGKELRPTTNVAAAVASCISGICERGVIGCESGSQWWEDYGPEKLGAATFKTNELWIGRIDYARFYFNDPARRSGGSFRLVSMERIDALRSILRDIADGVWTGSWGRDAWNGVWWGSSKFVVDYPEFPTWEWSSTPFFEIVERDLWAQVWPQFTSAVDDGVWRTNEHPIHNSPAEALDFLCFGPWVEDGFELKEWIRTNATPSTSCLDILTGRLGPAAVQFTNDTRQLSYHRLGAIETAIAAMDTTYNPSANPPGLNEYDVTIFSMNHVLGYTSKKQQGVVFDFEGDSARIVDEFDWQPFETTLVVTGKSFRTCASAACIGDNPSGFISIDGAVDVNITASYLRRYVFGSSMPQDMKFDNIEINSGGGKPAVNYGLYTLRGEDWRLGVNVIEEVPGTNHFDIVASSGVVRETTIYAMTNSVSVGIPANPAAYAWREDMVSDRVTAIEYAVMATNAVYTSTDMLGTQLAYNWFHDDDRIYSRSVLVGEFTRESAYKSAMTARKDGKGSLRAYVHGLVRGELGVASLLDPAVLLPIPARAAKDVRDGVGTSLKIYTKPAVRTIEIRWFGTADAVAHVTKLDGSTYDICPLPDDFRIPVGQMFLTGDGDGKVETDLKGHRPCHAYGLTSSAERTRWKFKNLHEEEE